MNNTAYAHPLGMLRDCSSAITHDVDSLTEADPLVEAGARRLGTATLKRLIDIFGATVGLVMLSPFFLLVGLLISIETRGWPLFRQRRTGYLGAPFVIYKFRTMRVCEDGAQIVQARRRDDRITRLGYLLRRTSIDELPQLINVLKGEMSLVGPRPHALAHDEYYNVMVRGYAERFRAKPGLTGLAQVSGLRGETADIRAMAARVAKDIEYIRQWSLLMDIKILLRTTLIFAFHPAAY